jgi:hypothetical protein
MKVHLREKGTAEYPFQTDEVYCKKDFHPLHETDTSNPHSTTCRTCKKLWGKDVAQRNKK